MSTNESIPVYVNLNFSTDTKIEPDPVCVKGKTSITFILDSTSVDAGYSFAGYADYSPGTGSQLTGTSLELGAKYQLNYADNAALTKSSIKVTLFIRNNCNEKIRFSYDPQIVNDR
ncbi:DP-EP family protein [Undibacterium sp. Di26W]|uniref:DP-EP family protein n=1 Tax=Undibacterium sp. Di26W TaxID=3413035 RepID=UPI003BF0E76A